MNTCLVCDKKDFVYKPYGDSFGLLPKGTKIQICTTCGLGRVTCLPSTKSIEVHYEGDSYHKNVRKNVNRLVLLPNNRALGQYGLLASHIDFKNVNHLLDFGDGPANIMRTIKIKHPHVTTSVVELSKSLRILLTDCNEIDRVYKKIPASLASQDLIIILHTLEHLIDPVATIKMFRNLLTEKGYLFVEVPNCPFPGYYNYRRNLYPHLSYFTENSLIQMAKICNFELVWIGDAGIRIKNLFEGRGIKSINQIETTSVFNKQREGLRVLLRKKGEKNSRL